MLPTSQGCFQKNPDPGKLNTSNSDWPSKKYLRRERKRGEPMSRLYVLFEFQFGHIKGRIYDTVWLTEAAMVLDDVRGYDV